MVEGTRTGSVYRRIVGEPTFHFLLIAAVLFGVQAAFSRGDALVIEVDRAEVAARIAELEAAGGESLSVEQRRAVEEAYIDEQILVREALAMGLEDDPRIRDFLVQKMLHVLSADVIQPTEAELSAHYDANAALYAPAPHVTFDEIVVASADELPPALVAQLRTGTEPGRLTSELAIRSAVIERVPVASLGSAFGDATAELIGGAPEGVWVGPHHTLRGQHWFRVTERTPTLALPFEEAREQIRLDWIAAEEARRLAQRVAELRGRYSIVQADGGEGE